MRSKQSAARKAECAKDKEGRECSGHGGCLYGQCDCRLGWTGDICAESISAMKFRERSSKDGCPQDCSGNGKCGAPGTDNANKCLCNSGYVGVDCSKMSSLKLEEVTKVRKREPFESLYHVSLSVNPS